MENYNKLNDFDLHLICRAKPASWRYDDRLPSLRNTQWLVGYVIKSTKPEKYYIIKELLDVHKPNCTFDSYSTEILASTICRCTGILDVNNKPIFDGDIIMIDEKYPRLVKWSPQKETFILMYDFDGDWAYSNTTLADYDLSGKHFEIIDNILDCPRLLSINIK